MKITDSIYATGYRSTESVVVRLADVRISMDPATAVRLANLLRNEATYANGGEAPVTVQGLAASVEILRETL